MNSYHYAAPRAPAYPQGTYRYQPLSEAQQQEQQQQYDDAQPYPQPTAPQLQPPYDPLGRPQAGQAPPFGPSPQVPQAGQLGGPPAIPSYGGQQDPAPDGWGHTDPLGHPYARYQDYDGGGEGFGRISDVHRDPEAMRMFHEAVHTARPHFGGDVNGLIGHIQQGFHPDDHHHVASLVHRILRPQWTSELPAATEPNRPRAADPGGERGLAFSAYADYHYPPGLSPLQAVMHELVDAVEILDHMQGGGEYCRYGDEPQDDYDDQYSPEDAQRMRSEDERTAREREETQRQIEENRRQLEARRARRNPEGYAAYDWVGYDDPLPSPVPWDQVPGTSGYRPLLPRAAAPNPLDPQLPRTAGGRPVYPKRPPRGMYPANVYPAPKGTLGRPIGMSRFARGSFAPRTAGTESRPRGVAYAMGRFGPAYPHTFPHAPHSFPGGRDPHRPPAPAGAEGARYRGAYYASSLPSSHSSLSPEKAKKILSDGSVRGHPLTDRQRRFMGAVAGRGT